MRLSYSPLYCKDDSASLYIGQKQYLSDPKHRVDAAFNPPGFTAVAFHWDGLCSYVGTVLGDPAYVHSLVYTLYVHTFTQ